jgi:hypothetical protein
MSGPANGGRRVELAAAISLTTNLAHAAPLERQLAVRPAEALGVDRAQRGVAFDAAVAVQPIQRRSAGRPPGRARPHDRECAARRRGRGVRGVVRGERPPGDTARVRAPWSRRATPRSSAGTGTAGRGGCAARRSRSPPASPSWRRTPTSSGRTSRATGRVAAGVAAGARRRYDPAAAFARVCDGWLDDCAGVDLWAEVVRLEPAPGPSIADRLDDALSVVADIVDVKTPSTAGHSRAVAAVGGRAAELLRAGDGDAAVVRRAGLVHDLGRVTVSNAVWERLGPLTGADWEAVRLHPYRTERFLARAAWLAPRADPRRGGRLRRSARAPRPPPGPLAGGGRGDAPARGDGRPAGCGRRRGGPGGRRGRRLARAPGRRASRRARSRCSPCSPPASRTKISRADWASRRGRSATTSPTSTPRSASRRGRPRRSSRSTTA